MRRVQTDPRPVIASVLALLLAGACISVTAPASGGPGATTAGQPTSVAVPTVNVPSVAIPTVPVPSVAIPTISVPSVALPSIALPSFALPSFALPSFELPSFQLPSFALPTPVAGGGTCSIISAEEMATVAGQAFSLVASGTPTNCTFIGDFSGSSNITGLNGRTGSGETIEVGKLIAPGGQDIQISGHNAYWGAAFGGGLLYVDLGNGDTLVVQIVTATDIEAAKGVAVKIAEAVLT